MTNPVVKITPCTTPCLLIPGNTGIEWVTSNNGYSVEGWVYFLSSIYNKEEEAILKLTRCLEGCQDKEVIRQYAVGVDLILKGMKLWANSISDIRFDFEEIEGFFVESVPVVFSFICGGSSATRGKAHELIKATLCLCDGSLVD